MDLGTNRRLTCSHVLYSFRIQHTYQKQLGSITLINHFHLKRSHIKDIWFCQVHHSSHKTKQSLSYNPYKNSASRHLKLSLTLQLLISNKSYKYVTGSQISVWNAHETNSKFPKTFPLLKLALSDQEDYPQETNLLVSNTMYKLLAYHYTIHFKDIQWFEEIDFYSRFHTTWISVECDLDK